jgi:4-hydroxy-tetrahydrodipicolinate synthase
VRVAFTGVSAFPITPLTEDSVDYDAFGDIVLALSRVGVDSIGALGSTGSYPYLSEDERAEAAQIAVQAAAGTPVIVGVGALTTSGVIGNVEAAQAAGAAGVLLSAMTYQPLTEDELFGLYADVNAATGIPIVVYDNPRTTQTTFSDATLVRIAELEHVASIKLPGNADSSAMTARYQWLRHHVPADVSLGVSGDAFATDALLGGADVWYSVLAGTLPQPIVDIVAAVRGGDSAAARAADGTLQPMWSVFAEHGSYRVSAYLNQRLGLTDTVPLRRPIRPLTSTACAEVDAALATITGTNT